MRHGHRLVSMHSLKDHQFGHDDIKFDISYIISIDGDYIYILMHDIILATKLNMLNCEIVY